MSTLNRRDFLTTTAATVGTLSALAATGAANQPNERIRIAVMGVRGRGRQLLAGFSAIPNVQITHICEVDDNVVPAAMNALNANHQGRPVHERDIRRIVENRDIDALVVAAPDHWHALATVWACQNNKHVYVEKPASHNIIEGRRMVQAARHHNRVVQVGTQRRSSEMFRTARELVASGRLGKIPFVRTWIAGNRPRLTPVADGPVPQGVDFNLWSGPAPLRPFNANRFHYNWHWHWDYATGEIGNNGIHALDMVRGLIPNLGHPQRISGGGGLHFYEDGRETPDTQIATYDFEHTTVVWEHRFWSRTGFEDSAWGLALYCENGTLIFDGRGWRIEDAANGVEGTGRSSDMERPHYENFLNCIRNGGRPNADIEEGHLSTRLCHLGNIAYRTQKTLHFNAEAENFGNDQEANRLLGREYRQGFVLPERV
jgi:predicted dehydrogenase